MSNERTNPPMTRRSGLRGAFSRMFAPSETIAAEHEQEVSRSRGGTPVEDLEIRHEATVCGVLKAVTLRPRAGTPAMEAELYDGTGTLILIFLGRRRITGIDVGRRLTVHGMVTRQGTTPAIYNPRYELMVHGR